MIRLSSRLTIKDITDKETVLLDEEIDQPCVIYETINLYNKGRGINPWRYVGSDWNCNPDYFVRYWCLKNGYSYGDVYNSRKGFKVQKIGEI